MSLTPREHALVLDAARRLTIEPRTVRWAHLSLCVLDAVFSINNTYESTTYVARRYAAWASLDPLMDVGKARVHAEQPLPDFVSCARELGVERLGTEVLRNRQLTSTRGGIRKAEAATRYAGIIVAHGLSTFDDMTAAAADLEAVTRLEVELARVPGHGQGARVDYLWMLAGDDHRVKPDRMVFGWLRSLLGHQVSYPAAGQALATASAALDVTPWELDHAVWLAQRARRLPRSTTTAAESAQEGVAVL